MNGGQKWVTSDERIPPKEESSMRKGSAVHDKSQVETEGEPKTEPKSRPTKDEEEEDRGRKGIPALVLETSAVALVCQCETRETEGGGDETKVEADAYEVEIAEEVGETTEDGNTGDSCPLILETSVVVFKIQREIGETGGGGKKGKVGSRFGSGWDSDPKENRPERGSTRSKPID